MLKGIEAGGGRPTFAILYCGGTITECYDANDRPSRISFRKLMEISDLPASWPIHELDAVDSVELTFETIFRAKSVIQSDVSSRGFILICGSDTLDEFAYAASLLLPRDRPIVVTCAMLPYSFPGSDGARNLVHATAVLESIVDPVMLVTIAGAIFEPTGLVKMDAQALQPFASRLGEVGVVRGERCLMSRINPSAEKYDGLHSTECTAKVAIVSETLGGVTAGPDVHEIDGLVVAAAGAGGLSERTRKLLRDEYIPSVPVVLSTRCPFGFTVNPDTAKYSLNVARTEGLIIDGYTGLNALQARVRLILQLGLQKQHPSL